MEMNWISQLMLIKYLIICDCVSKSAAFQQEKFFAYGGYFWASYMCKALCFNCKTFSGFKKSATCSCGNWTIHLRPVWLSTECVWAKQRSRFWFIHGWMRGRIESSLNISERLSFIYQCANGLMLPNSETGLTGCRTVLVLEEPDAFL